jgi:hypothetical protein
LQSLQEVEQLSGKLYVGSIAPLTYKNTTYKKIIQEIDKHEAGCRFRLVTCNICNSPVDFQRYLQHLYDIHHQSPAGLDAAADMQESRFDCNKGFFATGMTKLVNGNIFNINYSFQNQQILVHILYLPDGNVLNSSYSLKFDMWSGDKKVNLTFTQEVEMKPNDYRLVFGVGKNILKTYHGRDINFKTTSWIHRAGRGLVRVHLAYRLDQYASS